MEKMSISSAIRAFAQAKPWRMAAGGALVMGIEGMTDQRAYAVVTGRDNGYTLALCRDTHALSAYAALLTAQKQHCDDIELAVLLLEQDYLECRLDEADDSVLNRMLSPFGIKIPKIPSDQIVLRRHTPARLPDLRVNTQDEEQMSIALSAAVSFAQLDRETRTKLGTMDGNERIPCGKWTGEAFEWSVMSLLENSNVEFTSPVIQDELTVRRLRKIPVSGASLMCAVRILPMPISEDPVAMPWMLVILDDMNGVVGTPIVADYEADYSALVGELLGYIEECGRPSKLITVDPRTACLLGGIASQLGIAMENGDQVEPINETIADFLGYMKQSMLSAQEEAVQEHPEPKKGSGICMECLKEFPAEEMEAHVLSCDSRLTEEDGEENYIIRIGAKDDPDYWLYIELKKDAAFYQLDNFIREQWVECCGHMSMFRVQGEEFYSRCDEMTGGRSMKTRIAKWLKAGMEFDYEYDFGTPTCLHLEVLGEVRLHRRAKKVRLSAQNIRPQYRCVKCGKAARWVYRPGAEPIEQAVYCDQCAQQGEDAPFMLPLLNTPRAGVCGMGRFDDFEIE